MRNREIIFTERLYSIALTKAELQKYVNDRRTLMHELGISLSKNEMDGEEKDAIVNQLLPNFSDTEEKYVYTTMWLIFEKEKKQQVGGFCFHGPPDENGEIEVGYGTDLEYQGHGYMTEMIYGILNWAKNREELNKIIAKTDKSNVPSFRVLEKNNFKYVSEKNNLVTWEYPLK